MNSFIDFFFFENSNLNFVLKSFNLTCEPKIDNKKHSEKIEKSPKLIIGKNWTKIEFWTKIENWTKIEKSRPN